MNLNTGIATAKSHHAIALVVDDNLDSIHMLNDTLEAAGFTVLVALEGAQALTITKNIRPDIILLDAIMPHMDGFETCKQLKRQPPLTDVPILFMTGLSDTEHVVMGLGAGGVDYITKPINTHELIARMRVHLANARIAQQARRALDSAGQFLFTIDLEGQLLWATPQVYELLADAEITTPELTLADPIHQQLREWLSHKPESGRQLPLNLNSQGLGIEMLNLVDKREYLLRLHQRAQPEDETQSLRQQFAVTGREADVLRWIANGKTNREIGQILDMSPRTVNKHLEQIFKKLGVENRTSAAAAAIKCLSKP
ncbi:response regulator transcription factor [Cellvibrio japonicus]|uniref:Two-component transcriptional regulator, LuxR family n=1 Tax=Cellvibrio japonicus (strain Ueda107) TaxID=498211 RepID=B3PLC9_CELJU|nr:response regulator [Cellvibrio japonicus]ACE83908.1 two-component transcriptional regulator, LuxR family [Cellvibrio japonicus Ueda107]QEI11581.1 response regulator transcription factor [Cellvibrio japonicus]QEI15155.1 response regulator transcription factor [Cellvibrio japonicus]QEI18735.1 response regulator transcription factor [Cellvibrio japonicus]